MGRDKSDKGDKGEQPRPASGRKAAGRGGAAQQSAAVRSPAAATPSGIRQQLIVQSAVELTDDEADLASLQDDDFEDDAAGLKLQLADSDDNEPHDGDEEVGDAIADYVTAIENRESRSGRPNAASTGALAESDSSEDEDRIPRNTVGDIPLEWYEGEKHIGYDRSGKTISRGERKDAVDDFLDKADRAAAWRTVWDEYNGEEVVLSRQEVAVINRLRTGRMPHADADPFPEYVDWATSEKERFPLSSAPEPKRRFVPSAWEARRVVRLVRALRRGWLKTEATPTEGAPRLYLLWEDGAAGALAAKTQAGLTYIPAPKAKLPGHAESYNAPVEYLPTPEERAEWAAHADDAEEDGGPPAFVPTRYGALRLVPAYARFVAERFERCLDLYLCPRARRARPKLNIDPESLVPLLPRPRELRPFPEFAGPIYEGHKGKVLAVAAEPSGRWLATAGEDGTVRVFEVMTARCARVFLMGEEAVRWLAWCPLGRLRVLAAVSGTELKVWDTGVGTAAHVSAATALLAESVGGGVAGPWQTWPGSAAAGGGASLKILLPHAARAGAWHGRGDYLVTVAPDGASRAVLIHQLSTHRTQAPFSKACGRPVRASFHPVKPFLFVANQTHIRVYNLLTQQLVKKLGGGPASISCLAIHGSGDHVLIGGADRKLAWFDLDLSVKPYKTLASHAHAIQAVAFHRSYPLFASASDDGSAHVFHGTVYADLLQNPLIVPLKVLRGHTRNDAQGILDITFHPLQPWLFTAGADGFARLHVN